MAIENVQSMNKVLKNYDADYWRKDVDLKTENLLNYSDAPSFEIQSQELKGSFGELLADAVGRVNKIQKEANKAIEKLATGQSKNIHETMLAVERADIAFKTMNQIRTKVIDAYREIMKMQV